MKTFKESGRLFLVYMSFFAFLAVVGAMAYYLVRVLPN